MEQEVHYWDTSAVLSAFLQDVHTPLARDWLEQSAVNLVSSLTGSEFHACLARLERDGHLTTPLAEATIKAFDHGPWRRIDLSPDWRFYRDLAVRYRLRGADLWHLAVVLSLRQDLPTIKLLTFDVAMQTAATEEGLA